jgi:hypothetical protein
MIPTFSYTKFIYIETQSLQKLAANPPKQNRYLTTIPLENPRTTSFHFTVNTQRGIHQKKSQFRSTFANKQKGLST